MRGIPHAILVDPTGTVVWRGHPGALDGLTLEAHLDGAFKTPMWEWGSDAKDVRKAILRGELGKALEAAGEVQSMPELKGQVQAQITSRLSALEARNTEGNFLAASELAGDLAKTLEGLPEGARAGELSAAIAADADAQRIIKGQRKVAKIRDAGETSSKKISAALEDLRDLAREYAGTYVETECDDLIAQMQEKLRDR